MCTSDRPLVPKHRQDRRRIVALPARQFEVDKVHPDALHPRLHAGLPHVRRCTVGRLMHRVSGGSCGLRRRSRTSSVRALQRPISIHRARVEFVSAALGHGGEGIPGSEQNLALRLPRDEVLLIGPLAAKLGRQVDHPAHVALQLTPQQCVCQPLTGQLAKAWNQASKTLSQSRWF